MPSIASALGLSSSRPGLSGVPCRAPYYFAFHFCYAYGILASRTMKQFLGIDNMAMPREDSRTVGEEAVKSGKITRAQLNMVKRFEAASANSVENFTLFVAAILSAQVAGVPNVNINRAALVYTGARIAYGLVYVLISDPTWALTRGFTWWIGNLSCGYLLWESAKNLAVQ